jgi:glycine/D-amino acid oxidase-like deaminating enzyme
MCYTGIVAHSADVVICGAGIAGISVAYHLAVRHGVRDVLLVDELPPLSLTSDKSTEAYRNWWPGPDDAMVRLMNRSIDLLEELAEACDNRFLLNRRGYLWLSADPATAEEFRNNAELSEAQGAGQLRIHSGRRNGPAYLPHRVDGWTDQPDGADLILDRALIREHFPYLSEATCAALHTRRCGWFSGQQLGMEQLERARASGARMIDGRVEDVIVDHGRVSGVRIAGRGSSTTISTRCFVNAAGPHLKRVASMIGVELPVYSELHLKVSIEDHLGIVPRDAPLLTWQDPQLIAWTDDERELLASDELTRWLTRQMPAGVHLRPEGRSHLLILWPYHAEPVPESFPIEILEGYAEICLRGITTMIPGMAAYLDPLPRPYIDGGYYTMTRENRPLAGPLPVPGAFVHGALSGFGLMAAYATSELLAHHITGKALPDHAATFALDRYDDPEYLKKLENWGDTGQL